ncbi:hypothetical protein [Paenibacillus tarimensis]|uniref:hypothetical protein n=1 Tax=Paenibacillus tarimensis TaxID=416012 RepID=UPI001F42CB9E|nr:hypothetical protein [Paenibacillus tarimensis]MCF2945760.1 hypothetical protein [Paenibacillus tarimensis]
MPFTKINGVPGYILYMTNVYMDETRIYTMVSDTWQPDEDMTYQGAAWYSYPEAAWRTFIFPQDNITHVSGSGTEGTLYYTVDHPEEQRVTIYKLNCRTLETTEIMSLKPAEIAGSGEGQNAHYTLRGINARYALMQLFGERAVKWLLLDSVGRECLVLPEGAIPIDFEDLQLLECEDGTLKLLFKSGQYMSGEKEAVWRSDRVEPHISDHLFLISIDELVRGVRTGELSLDDFEIESCGRECSLADYFIHEGRVMYYKDNFISRSTTLTCFDPARSSKEVVGTWPIHIRLSKAGDSQFLLAREGDNETVIDRASGERVVKLRAGEHFLSLEAGRLYTCKYLPQDESALMAVVMREHADDEGEIIGKGLIVLEEVHDRFLIIEQKAL